MAKMGFFGAMKRLEDAESGIKPLPRGGVSAWIRHETMRGVTPAMMRWWFENIDQMTTYNGKDFSGPPVLAYRFWHPWDHIRTRWTKKRLGADGRIGVGSVIAIEEDVGGVYEVRVSATVSQFDDKAFNFDMKLLGMRVGRLYHLYESVEGGASFYTELRLESSVPILGRMLVKLARRFYFTDEILRAWLTHNVEEVGETEKFVPALYAHAQENSSN